MSGNDLHIRHCASVLMKELHTFAQATGAPAGQNVFRWAEQKADEVSKAHLHPAPTDRVAELEAALDHPLLRQVLGFVEDCAPDEVMNTLRLWQDTQSALLSAQPRAKGEG